MNETELLFTEVLQCDRAQLYLQRQRRVHPREGAFISRVLVRRMKGEPLQYILGKADFMGLSFKVNPQVLIPRPETELLAEEAIARCRRISREERAVRVLDMCTGSGALAVALAHALPRAEVTAADISGEALAVAGENAAAHRVRISFVESDLFSAFDPRRDIFDCIVVNPPYVAREDIAGLSPEVRHEPALALDGGDDGLEMYRRLAAQAGGFLSPGGYFLTEIGAGQAAAVTQLLAETGVFASWDVRRDYNGIERIVTARVK
jgi:release factor glutamine methyltransferase